MRIKWKFIIKIKVDSRLIKLAEMLLGLNDIQNANTFINKALDINQNYELAIKIKGTQKYYSFREN